MVQELALFSLSPAVPSGVQSSFVLDDSGVLAMSMGLDATGLLHLSPAGPPADHADRVAENTAAQPPLVPLARLQLLKPKSPAAPPGLAIVSSAPDFRVNGLRPFLLRVAYPGDVLSLGKEDFLLVRRFRPSPQEVPAALASKPCAVCGMPLSLSSVCHCVCGTFFHLENPQGSASSESELNCFLASPTCSICGHPRRLEAQLIPEPSSLGWPIPSFREREVS